MKAIFLNSLNEQSAPHLPPAPDKSVLYTASATDAIPELTDTIDYVATDTDGLTSTSTRSDLNRELNFRRAIVLLIRRPM